MKYNQISATLNQLTALYEQQAKIYSNWSSARQQELDRVKQEIGALEAQYSELKSN